MAHSENKLTYRKDIDGLRAFAVIAVVLFHFNSKLMPGGFVGVDVFLIISGFLITGIIIDRMQAGVFSLKDFYFRRILRIFPALALILGFGLVLGWFALYPNEYFNFGRHVEGGAEFVSNIMLKREAGYFDTASDSKPLLHLWSLSVEEQFYIFWPLILLFAWRKKRSIFQLAIGLALISFVANLFFNYVWPNSAVAYFLLPSRAWEFMLGGVLSQVNLKNELITRGWRSGISVISLLVLFASLFVIDRGAAFPGWIALLPTMAAVGLIFSGPAAWVNRHWLSHPAVVLIGLFSYPLYLWHWPLLSFLRIVEGMRPPLWSEALAVSISVILAFATYKCVELPIRHAQAGGIKPKYVWSLVATLAVMAVLGSAVRLDRGFPGRNGFVLASEVTEQLQRAESVDSDCEAYVSLPHRLFDYCRSNLVPNAKRVVALVGDSHAHVAFPGFSQWFAKRGISTLLMAGSGCPLLPGLAVGKNSQVRNACLAQAKQALNVILSHKEISDVIVFARGTLYMSKATYGGKESDAGLLSRLLRRESIDPPHLFEKALAVFSKTVVESGRQIFYMFQTPELDFDPVSCFKRPMSFTLARCSLPLVNVVKEQSAYREAVFKAKTEVPQLRLLDPLPEFCAHGSCPVVENGQLLYADENHISKNGSQLVAPMVLDPVSEVFKK